MRILHLIDSFDLGGAQTILKGILDHPLAEQTLYGYALRQTPSTTPFTRNHFEISPHTSRFSLRPLFALRHLIRREKISILHCHLFRAQVFGYGLKLFFFPRLSLVFHEHGRIFGAERGGVWEDRFFVAFLRLAKPKVDRFIAVSRATRDRLMARADVDPAHIDCLANAIDCQHFKPTATAENERAAFRLAHGISSDEFVVGFVGRLVKIKGWQEWLEACERVLANTQTAFKFLIAGTGPDAPLAADWIERHHLTEKIMMLGFVADMVPFYRGIDCLTIPSHWESMSMVAVEARAAGVPVIASNVPSINEIIDDGKNGLLVPAHDPEALAERIQYLATAESTRRALVQQGLAAAQAFDFPRYTERLNKIYEALS